LLALFADCVHLVVDLAVGNLLEAFVQT